jgi:hypothetical protein
MKANVLLAMAGLFLAMNGCGPDNSSAPAASDRKLNALGTVEVTARLVEIPEGAIFKRELYDYVTILKYQVLKVHRGEVKRVFIYVGQYNPFKPRAEAADRHVTDIGGSVRQFQSGHVHRMALDVPIDDFYMGGIINKYFGQETGPIYFARWTDVESK